MAEYGGHYYVTPEGGTTALDAVMRRMSEVVEHSGPQLIHFHRHGERCAGHAHRRCDSFGTHDVIMLIGG